MAVTREPRVSIGIPVYNGAPFLEEALQSVLAQSYEDFELLISDDGSTDGSFELCERYARADSRVNVSRSDAPRGPAHNFNRVFALSRGELFKWCAADDVIDPFFIERCIEELDSDPRAVLAYSHAQTLSTVGTLSEAWGGERDLASACASTRWRAALAPPRNPMPIEIFGVARHAALARTRLFGGFPDCDRFLVAELALQGPFVIVDEVLMIHREHGARLGLQLAADSFSSPLVWLGPDGASMRFPHWRLAESITSLPLHAPMGVRDRARCVRISLHWGVRNRGRLVYDIARNAEGIPWLGEELKGATTRLAALRWARRTRRVAATIAAQVLRGERVVLIDDNSLDRRAFSRFEAVALCEDEGAPPDGPSAVAALEEARQRGARYVAVCWPSFWWLDYYRELSEHLETQSNIVARGDDVALYAL